MSVGTAQVLERCRAEGRAALMPYRAFLAAAEDTRHDLERLSDL